MRHLFKPFSQADVSVSRNFGGTGLGLVICQRLAEMLGGNIVAESSLGLEARLHSEWRQPMCIQHKT